MCGIVGSLSFNSSSFKITEPFINEMRDSLTHRGPDGFGTWISDKNQVGLGHRRLSIIDLSHAAGQPMSNEDNTLWLTYNGEIYNHAEIRKELESLGYNKWKTDHSDTEVILYAFQQWGIDCIHRFRGMFAFGLWDEINHELWLVRDRIGIKPLYYSIHNNRINFASEIKALLKDQDQHRSVNEESFFHYMTFFTTPAPETLFKGIKKLQAGNWLRISADGTLREHRYWDVLDHTKSMEGIPEEEISEMLLSELRISVNLRKVSDVPIGVFLSGGIDSSTNAALFSENGDRVNTFTIGYDREYASYQNELVYAKMMAEKVNGYYNEKLLSIDDLLNYLPNMVSSQDEPISDPVCVPLYYVSKLAKENGITVCQVGEGADELFWGYDNWKRFWLAQKYNDFPIPRIIKRTFLLGMEYLGMKNSFKYEALRRGCAGQPLFWGGAIAFTDSQKQNMLSSRLKKYFSNYSSWEVIKPIRENFEENAYEKSNLNWMTYLDLRLRLPELLLMRVDKMSMSVGLETRVPFLDHKFVELAMSIPESIKTKNKEKKAILKQSVRNLIPSEIIDRPKQGFGVPVYEWFFDKLGEKAKNDLYSFTKKTDYLSQNSIDVLFQKKEMLQIWHILNFAMWYNRYIDNTN
tara:strand:+ start:8371 stop:10275 length:1905 start_codon:yes stop_codon:yes gene_type:complete